MKGKYLKKTDEGSKGWKKKLLISIGVVVAVLLVIFTSVFIWTDSLLDDIGRIDENEQTLSSDELAEILDPMNTDPEVEQADSIFADKNIVNILLVGQDRRPGEARMHSDAMILCTINKATNTLTMTSFMRDMWVYIPDHYNERINVPYMVGGFPLLNETLEYNFGISADYNFEIDFNGFMNAIDLVGGIEIELTQKEANYLNQRGNWGVEENSNWDLKEGVNLLTGSQALAYSRIRAIGDDFARTNRQRTVLNELIEKAKTLSVTEIYKLVKAMLPLLATDMSNSQILGLVMEMLPMLSDLKVVSQRIPLDGEYSFANKNGASVIELSKSNYNAAKNLLINTMKTDTANP